MKEQICNKSREIKKIIIDNINTYKDNDIDKSSIALKLVIKNY